MEITYYSDRIDSLHSLRNRCIALFYTQIEGDLFQEPAVPRKRFLFFISPASGKGKALNFYNEYKRHFEYRKFTSRGLDIECQKFVTERRNHARDHIQNMPAEDLARLDGVICVSGDGIPHEVVNGFLLRPDHEKLRLNLGALARDQASFRAAAAARCSTTASKSEAWTSARTPRPT